AGRARRPGARPGDGAAAHPARLRRGEVLARAAARRGPQEADQPQTDGLERAVPRHRGQGGHLGHRRDHPPGPPALPVARRAAPPGRLPGRLRAHRQLLPPVGTDRPRGAAGDDGADRRDGPRPGARAATRRGEDLMCGVVAGLGKLDLAPAVAALTHRGPDAAGTVEVGGVRLGHTRLAVRDLNSRSDQPFRDGPVTIAYNGEIYNADELRQAVQERDPGRSWATTGDTEVLAAALAVLGPERALPLINGMFAVAWADDRRPGVLDVARDRHGEIPLHLHLAQPVMAASELKAFAAAGRPMAAHLIADVPAGQWGMIHGRRAEWRRFHTQRCTPAGYTLPQASEELKTTLARAVQRWLAAAVPVCARLSGGVDSATITYELAQHVPDLVAYNARMDPKSRDLRCARETAEYLGIRLVEVDIPPPTADDLARVVSVIEMPHKAQVEIGWACLQLAERIRSDGFKVTYSGEGSDELWASYGFAYHALQKTDWHIYRRDLMAAQARKNFPRVNKTFMAHSVEARLPFCDPDVVDLALSLPQHAVADGKARPKAVLQRAYDGLLPASVVKRPKVAFQDGLGLKTAIMSVLPNPIRFYKAEYQRLVRSRA